MKKMIFVVACTLFLLTGYAVAEEGDAILGHWYTDPEKKDAVVEIYKDKDVYSGKIVWLKNPKNDDGTVKVDKENPDEARRSDPLVGLNLVKGFTYKGYSKWAGGTIYDPNNGKTYKCKMKLKDDELKVRGYIGVSLLGRTTIWVRK
ncbi:MAG: DUF2147 domain-containing protein [Deltaproteobacteria bacterium]|jgi:uncharacterized protein (DUF2147 family)|nr:DUF2147 domain-containing protein [Deltaproteobacteria bacterium]